MRFDNCLVGKEGRGVVCLSCRKGGRGVVACPVERRQRGCDFRIQQFSPPHPPCVNSKDSNPHKAPGHLKGALHLKVPSSSTRCHQQHSRYLRGVSSSPFANYKAALHLTHKASCVSQLQGITIFLTNVAFPKKRGVLSSRHSR